MFYIVGTVTSDGKILDEYYTIPETNKPLNVNILQRDII